jgi:hypothetical protein
MKIFEQLLLDKPLICRIKVFGNFREKSADVPGDPCS